MKVLLVNQYFIPDVAAVAQLMGDLVEDMMDEGLEVGIIAGRCQYNQTRNDSASEPWNRKGCRVWRVPYIPLFSRGTTSRLLTYGTFMISAFVRMILCRRHDVVMSFTAPPLVGILAWTYGALRRAKVVSVVEDLYPDVALALGFLNPRGVTAGTLSRISVFLLRKSHRIVVLSKGMKERLSKKGIDEAKIEVIENWADSRTIQPSTGNANSFAVEHGVSGKFVVQYSGRMGEAHEFKTMLSAATLLCNDTEIHFQFIGDGPRREEIESYISEHGKQDNISLLPYQQRTNLESSLGAASVSVVTLRAEVVDLIVPSKFYGILAAGKPVVLIGSQECEIGRTITENGCGFVVKLGDVSGFARVVRELYENPELTEQMGKRARDLLIAKYDRGLQTAKYVRMLKEIGAQ